MKNKKDNDTIKGTSEEKMKDYEKTNKPNGKSTNNCDSLQDIRKENRELFKKALAEALELKIRNEGNEDVEISSPSHRHKIRMNRLFRERVNGSFLPFPEADNFRERIRSGLVIKLKINALFDRGEERRRMRKK